MYPPPLLSLPCSALLCSAFGSVRQPRAPVASPFPSEDFNDLSNATLIHSHRGLNND